MKSIAVYCSSSNKVDDTYKEEAKKVGNLLAKKGIRLVYGGGNMGLMGVPVSYTHLTLPTKA
mgnify:CR=1 FL=1